MLLQRSVSSDLHLNLYSIGFDTGTFIHAFRHAKLTHLPVVLHEGSGPI